VLWGVLAGCASHPLSEVPIEGGTPEVRGFVARALASFEAAAGVGRLELRAVRLTSADPRYDGRYNPTNRTLTLSTSASSADVYHELCHALFDQADLGRVLRDDPGPMDEVVARLFADPDLAPRLPLPTPSRRRSEAVATLCGAGPVWAADTGRGACETRGDDEVLAAEVGAWMSAQVWPAHVLPDGLVVDLAEAVWVSVDAVADRPSRFEETTDPGVVWVDGVSVDLYGGGPGATDVAPVTPERWLPPGSGMWVGSEADRAGWPLGPAGVAGTWLPHPLSASADRVIVHDGEAWRFVGDGCPDDGARWFFTADQRLWMAWWDGGLTWVPVADGG
jgi:hypothetical protein